MTDNKPKPKVWRWINMTVGVIGLLLASVICAPQLLAFPYQAQIGATRVYAEAPINVAAMHPVLARADALLAASPLYREPVGTRVFLTDGGWRWRLLALSSVDAPGFTRPGSTIIADAVMINRHDIARDHVAGFDDGLRTLSGLIAHERTHILVQRHLGVRAALTTPAWVNEGYADHVAGESPITSAQAAILRAEGSASGRLFYFDARRRVEAVLAASGGDVDALLRMR